MKISSIICEYNPMHAGHKFHIQETLKNGADKIIAVMSGEFVQRGDLAIYPFEERKKIALENGIDEVIELPVRYVLSPAEEFAMGAVSILDSLGYVNELSFGSECGDLEVLKKAAELSERYTNSPEIKALLKSGLNYPRAMKELTQCDVFDTPNNTLAIEYLKSLKKLNSEIKPFTVKRNFEFESSSEIREGLSGRSIYDFEDEILKKVREISLEDLRRIPNIGNQGLEYRIKKITKTAQTLDELFFGIKTKRYTMARIKRIVLCVYLGIYND
ncbi:MAG: nucleotidyltransferase family protein [Ruminococcus sp.]|jgi:predicted nucleotidyltransferase|nr:nucleotidyltransferase family protein [Ruminococcus sp.]